MKFFVISPGDPLGVGPEITVKAILSYKGGIPLLPCFDRLTVEKLKLFFPGVCFEKTDSDCSDLPFREGVVLYLEVEVGENDPPAAVALSSLYKAAELAMEHKVIMLTGPVNKKRIAEITGKPLGHTELLAEYTGTLAPETVFCLENLKVFFLSRHLSLRDAIEFIDEEKVFRAILSMQSHLIALGIQKPRLAVAALNPHAGDSGSFGDEEKLFIEPAVKRSVNMGIDVRGAIGADSVFHRGFEGDFDGILSLYHDQGHIALKSRNFYETVTMTLGLPFLRISVDHGTAEDIAWNGKADHRGMNSVVKLALELS